MAADLARISFDPTRKYRAVVAQQGRVTLEADVNEAATIASEAARRETIDFIGPAATPDDGYKPGPGKTPGDIEIGAGTFYLGGWRLTLDAPVELSAQPDALDLAGAKAVAGDVVVALLATEQIVSATEDQALREVALGGPDSAARTRLMQRFLQLPSDGSRTCPAGAATVAKLLDADGVSLDPVTYQLVSAARLQAGFVRQGGTADPCTPAAAGGYLGADNQLVRVTVTDYDPAKRTGTLLWSWNNASLLYRTNAASGAVLTLAGAPVDEEHAPQLGQAVEILRTQADLGGGNFVAAPQGFVTTVQQAYSFDTGQVTLAANPPAEYLADKTPLFVRLWQARVAFVAGQATPLDATSGLTVTITLPALPSTIALRPVWHFAVRPSTPVRLYPQRYLDAPQPPEGPRQWLADLAVVHNDGKQSSLVADCRIPFKPLPAETACCCLVLGPEEVGARGGLQTVIDGLGVRGCLSLRPGQYTLAAPLRLSEKHAGVTLEGCGVGVAIAADPANLSAFMLGLVMLANAPDVSLRRLAFDLPAVPQPASAPPANNVAGVPAAAAGPAMSFGVFAIASTGLTVEDCTFASAAATPVAGAAIAIAGNGSGTSVRRNHVSAPRYIPNGSLFGVVASGVAAKAATVLDNVQISDNLFDSVEAGVVCFSQFGALRCTGNRVTQCGKGLYFGVATAGSSIEALRQAQSDSVQSTQIAPALAGGLQPQMVQGLIAQSASFADLVPAAPAAPPTDAARAALLQDIGTRAGTTLRAISVSPTIALTALAATVTGAAAAPSGANAAPPAVPAAPAIDPVLLGAMNTVRDFAVDVEAMAAAAGTPALLPVLHISGNDVMLTPTQGAAGVGIAVAFSVGSVAETVLMTANRVVTGDARTVAAAVLFPTVAAVTGNVFLQTGDSGGGPPSFALIAQQRALFEVAANVVYGGAVILPARSTAAATNSWPFLNTVS